MGLTYDASRFLCAMRAADVSFGDMLTLGRQDLMVNIDQLRALRSEFTFAADASLGDNQYCESLIESMCGATVVDAVDATDYEGAKHVVDMNRPIEDDLVQSYDIVYDGGTLEHVFHFTTAYENALRMVKVGGWFVSHTIANGFMGHGFYQFSPELFFRTLTESSGFSSPVVVAQSFPTSNLGVAKGGPFYLVSDPEAIRERVLYSAGRPLSLLIAAKKVKHLDQPFGVMPQQSDYQVLWDEKTTNERREKRRQRYDKITNLPLVGSALSASLRKYHSYRFRSTRNQKYFQPISSSDLTKAIRQVSIS